MGGHYRPLWCRLCEGQTTLANTSKTSIRGAIYGITAASIWGGMYVVSDVVLRTIPPFTLLTLRLLIGSLILGIVLRWTHGELVLPRRETLRLLGVGLVGF